MYQIICGGATLNYYVFVYFTLIHIISKNNIMKKKHFKSTISHVHFWLLVMKTSKTNLSAQDSMAECQQWEGKFARPAIHFWAEVSPFWLCYHCNELIDWHVKCQEVLSISSIKWCNKFYCKLICMISGWVIRLISIFTATINQNKECKPEGYNSYCDRTQLFDLLGGFVFRFCG